MLKMANVSNKMHRLLNVIPSLDLDKRKQVMEIQNNFTMSTWALS